MKKNIKIIFCNAILLIILSVSLVCAVSGCSGRSDENKENLPPETETTQTVMIYICGGDLESSKSAASKNIAEMLEATIPENVNVIIQTGGATRWHTFGIAPNCTDRYIVKNGGLELVDRDLSNKNMGVPDTLIDFVNFGATNYSADKYSLILWNHGGGSVKGVCFDANFGYDGLTLPEIKTALESTAPLIGKKWEFIGFDACLMATYDTACILAPYAERMIASEELEPTSGWDYKTLISQLGADTFYDDLLNSYEKKHAKKTTYTLSVIHLSELNKADDVIDEIIEQINGDVSNAGKILAESKEFGSKKENGKGSNLFDIGLMAKALEIEYDFSSFITKTNGTAHEDASGISLYFPNDKKTLSEKYSAVCQNKKYLQFLNEYFDYVPKTPVEFIKRGYSDGEKMSFTLSAESKKYVRSTGYELLSYSKSYESDKLYCIGTDNDITVDNGVYTVNFTGNWVFINDTLLHCTVYEETDTYTIFSALVKVNGELGRLLFTYFKATHTVRIEGYTIDGDVTSRINDITNGTTIAVIYEDTSDKSSPNLIEEATITWNDDTELSVKKLEAGYYQYIPYVIDIYGSVYYGGTATVYFDGEKVSIKDIAEG